jgi:hypothetical protein
VPELVEYQLRHSPSRIEVLAVARSGVDQQALRLRMIESICNVVRTLGAEPPDIAVAFYAALERRPDQMGKLPQVHTI